VTGENTFWATRAADLVADFTALRTAITGAGWEWVIASYIADGAPRVGGPVYFPILSVAFQDLIVDSMRSRKPGVGN
jgi:hypothetical protein